VLPRLRRFLDVRPGEGLPVLLSFLYIAVVVAGFLLAKPVRNGLFLRQYGPYALVYVYAAVPLVLSIFVPIYTRITARFGTRTVAIGTLVFFSLNVVAFWYAFRFHPFELLPGIFFVWVNCYGVIAPVQAWSFANSLFDLRQAKRLFGLIGSGASLGAIAGGVLARYLVEPAGGAVNLMLVIAVLLLIAAAIVLVAKLWMPSTRALHSGPRVAQPFRQTRREILATPYLRHIAALAFLTAIATQWTAFQLSVVAEARFGGDADALTRFFGTFNFVLGIASFALQLLVTGRLLRHFGLTAAIVVLPFALATGNLFILMVPLFWPVLITNAFDQGLRFSIDKASYELLYLPIPPGRRAHVKNAIDIVVNRVADAVGAVLLGLTTRGFLMLPGLQFGLRGTAAFNLVTLTCWALLAWRLRGEYVRTIHESIHRHRLDAERDRAVLGTERSAGDLLREKLEAEDPAEIAYALDLIADHPNRRFHPALRKLLVHPVADVRRRSLSILGAGEDEGAAELMPVMLRDPDLGVRTEALLYLSRISRVDPLRQIQDLGEFEDFSIRAGMVAFLSAPGPTRNMETAALMLKGMASSAGPGGRRDRIEAARLIGRIAEPELLDLLPALVRDEEPDVARQAVLSAMAFGSEALVPPLLSALARPEIADEAGDALAALGGRAVPHVVAALADDEVPIEARRELPAVLLRIGTPEAEHALVSSLVEADGTVRHRIIASLNKLRAVRPDIRIDPHLVELLLAAEIAGHYRSYQVLGPLRAGLTEGDPVVVALRASMEEELERIFRLMGLLLFPQAGLHDAYVGIRSRDRTVRANALEFLENVLKPELRGVLLPLLDSQVTFEERLALADRLVGAPLETADQAVATLLASDDPWLRSSAIAAIGTLGLTTLAPELSRFAEAESPVVREAAAFARARLAGDTRPPPDAALPAPADLDTGVGAG